MSDLENELLGLAEDDPRSGKKRRNERKSQPYVDSDSGSEMDMDLESEEGENEVSAPAPPPRPKPASSSRPKAASRVSSSKQSSNPYPLEGRYIDEDDRDHLDSLPEIEREAILANRQEEMQKFKDSQQLDAMYRMAGGKGGEEEDEESEEEPSRKKRKHTSVSKEASRAMKDLKNKRKAKDERDARRAQRRERRRSGSASEEDEEEDGEITHPTLPARPKAYAYSPDRSPLRSPRTSRDPEKDVDAIPADAAELNAARVGRYEIVEMMYKDGFEGVVVGAYVRLMAGEMDQYGRPKYRIHRIEEIQEGSQGVYNIEYKGKQIAEDRILLCAYGRGKRLFRIADVSNGDVEETEFQRFGMTNRADNIKPPKRSDLKRKHEAIKDLRDRPMSSEEISRQVEARKRSNPAQQRHKITIEITNLITSRNLALRRNDSTLADDLNRQIVALGGDPQTGELVTLDKGQAEKIVSEYDDRIEKINENNKRKVREQMEKAHQGSLARKRAEEAIVRAKQAKEAAEAKAAAEALAAEEARTKALEQGEEGVIDMTTAAEDVKPAVQAAVDSTKSGLKKGETPQQFIARTIDLDLGDF